MPAGDDSLSLPTPALVLKCERNAAEVGFELSTSEAVGRLLAVLAASVPPNGRILELGTGAGVGLAWISHGVGSRTDVIVRSVESDAALVASVRGLGWPATISIIEADALGEVAEPAGYDLVFADAQGGKLTGLELTVSALRPGGILIMDDMDPVPGDPFHVELFPAIEAAGTTVLQHPELVALRLDHGTGVVLAAKRADRP